MDDPPTVPLSALPMRLATGPAFAAPASTQELAPVMAFTPSTPTAPLADAEARADDVPPSLAVAGPDRASKRLVTTPLVLSALAAAAMLVSAFGHSTAAWIALVPAAGALLLLPGVFLLAILGTKSPGLPDHAVKAVGVSLALIMVLGLAMNSTLPLFGIDRPLARTEVVVGGISLLVLLALGAAFRVAESPSWQWRTVWSAPGKLRLRPAAVFGAILIPAAAIGAANLNANRSASVSIATEVWVAVLGLFLIVSRRERTPRSYAWILFCQAAALLLLTSLRGQFLSGHDVLFEYSIFKVTLEHARWSMNYVHNPYNACLSLTIFPEMLSQVLSRLGGQYIFRIVDQLLFAVTPVAAYVIARRFGDAHQSYAAGFVFLASSALLRDFPYLTRQEIALLFLAALVVAFSQTRVGTWERRVLVTLFALGLIFSHYSTAYATVAIFIAALLLKTLLHLIRRDRLRDVYPLPFHRPNAVALAGGDNGILSARYVTLGFTAAFTAGVVIWQEVLTRASGGVATFVQAATQSVGGSGSVVGSAPSYGSLLSSYLSTHGGQAASLPGGAYPASAYSSYHAAFQVSENLKSTLSPTASTVLIRISEVSRGGLELLIVAGCLLLVRRAIRRTGSVDFAALCVGALSLIVAASLLPAVAVYYSPLRVYQQVLIVLGTAFMVVAYRLVRRLPSFLRSSAVAAVAVLAFLAASSLPSQYLGAPGASLQFNNFGQYYDLYYTHTSDLQAIDWLASHPAACPIVFADRFATARIATFSPRPIAVVNNVLPSDISRSGCVFEDVDNVTRGVAFALVNGNYVSYRFPAAFVAQTKRLVFSSGDVRIYQ